MHIALITISNQVYLISKRYDFYLIIYLFIFGFFSSVISDVTFFMLTEILEHIVLFCTG